ncbi:radical SAM protein [Sulfuriferula plumbiphila]|uniref:Radical SAM protein n=1 Tax=Sulfuriferula plumbiphila TaxID=171865 RepID=A0A512L3L7_9PROT|nr:CUAEP/CCAEP-tail radical SAM protein [Sulfuriferula plumbiphila]BBP02769.1 radical SAM protein [Sulfuriferula plumbiphila]GEP29063.1 radical SAM protein [Sulfuriferula plumbiphila]
MNDYFAVDWGETGTGSAPFKVVLINPYELGRQSFNLAAPAALLKAAGCEVACLDLTLQKLEPGTLRGAGLVAIHLGMHTATRIAIAALPKIRALAPSAHLAMYGLYAPMNADLLRGLGVHTLLGGESEPALMALAERLRDGDISAQSTPMVQLAKVEFLLPDRSGLPKLTRYAHLNLPDGGKKVVGFTETTRGCKHLCRHCPVVPVYQGRFRPVQVDVVLADIEQQVVAGAQHISFGDPDFFNGPTHALRVLETMHRRFPNLSFDATIKIQHLLDHADLLPRLRDYGCLFITSAVESVDDAVLEYLDKNHTRAGFERALGLCRTNGIFLAPTFVPFNPWTTLTGYIDLLGELLRLKLVQAVPPVQLAIRLLVPQGSYLLQLSGFADRLEAFDPALLGYPWRHADPRVDALQQQVMSTAMQMENAPRGEVFRAIWLLAHRAAGLPAPTLEHADFGETIAHLSEPWYCCAEPTDQQLQSF